MIAEHKDLLELPRGELEVVIPSINGPKIHYYKFQNGLVVKAVEALIESEIELENETFQTQSEVIALAINFADFTKRYLRAFAF